MTMKCFVVTTLQGWALSSSVGDHSRTSEGTSLLCKKYVQCLRLLRLVAALKSESVRQVKQKRCCEALLCGCQTRLRDEL